MCAAGAALCRVAAHQDDLGSLLSGAAGREIVCDDDAQYALAVIADHHGGLRVAVDPAGPLDPEIHGIAAT